ncbi:MAG: T9SS type A sorting domain-containing protein, partial [Ginsengibacter sp.]
IDLSTGKVSNTIFESGKTRFSLAKTSKEKSMLLDARDANNLPTQSMVAAAAYDKRHNKLFFTPMRIGELRWLDLSTKSDPTFYVLQDQLLNNGNLNDEANQITRMVIGADGNGYAITNDANHLIRFTTGKKTAITDMGNLIDASSNNGISIHNKCSSWGGDMVADVHGKLYLFSSSQSVFAVDIESRVATYLGNIKNLTPTFTVNGAAVDNDDNIIIGSANTFEGFYKINIKDLSASKINTAGQVFNASDLANSNLLFESQVRNEVGVPQLIDRETIGNDIISIYPNPVSNNQFKVTFDNTRAGKYDIALTDVQGRLIMSKQVNIKFANQVETLQMKLKPAGGIYLVKVTDANKKSIFSDKIMVD